MADTFSKKELMSVNGMVRPCSCPASKRSWARGTKDKEHAMSQTPNTAIAVIGIDIGKNSFHVVGHDARGARGATACHFPRVRSLAAFGRRLRCKPHRCIRRHPKPSTQPEIRVGRFHSALIFAALMIGHHFSTSAL
jgi:hypothetical protein